jgi:hypothetical protein
MRSQLAVLGFFALVCLMFVCVGLIMLEMRKVELESYNDRLDTFYGDFFEYLKETNQTIDEVFNYTPEKPPQDLSKELGIL